MHVEVAKRLALAISQSEVTQPVAVEGNNTLDCECVMYSGNVDIEYQQGNDLENWTPLGTAFTTLTPPYALLGSQAVTASYVRLKVTENTGTAVAVVALGVNLSAQ